MRKPAIYEQEIPKLSTPNVAFFLPKKPNSTTPIDRCREMKKDPEEFYDITINVNKLNLTAERKDNGLDSSDFNSWEVTFSQEGAEKYYLSKRKESFYTIVSAFGSKSKGKSYVLSNVFRHKFGGSSTKGICVYFKKFDSNQDPIVCIDSGGFEAPVVKGDLRKTMIERKYTKKFVEMFLIEKSTFPILVVGELESSDQIMFEQFESFQSKVYIVHNLKNLKYISEVNDYIELELMKIFSLEKEEVFLSEDFPPANDNDWKSVYFERKNNRVHLIVAGEGTEAGNYFNKFAFKYLRVCASIETRKRHFEIIEELMEFYSLKSYEFLSSYVPKDLIKYSEKRGKIYVDRSCKNNDLAVLNKWKSSIVFLRFENQEDEWVVSHDYSIKKEKEKIFFKIKLPGGERYNKIYQIDMSLGLDKNVITIKVDSMHRPPSKDGEQSMRNINFAKLKFMLLLPFKFFGILTNYTVDWDKEFIDKASEYVIFEFSNGAEEEIVF